MLIRLKNTTLASATLYLVLLSFSQVFAATYTVKTSGGDYSTPGACANDAPASMSADHVCEVYTGSYSGWTQTDSGSNGYWINVIEADGESASISGSISCDGTSHVSVQDFTISGGIGCSDIDSRCDNITIIGNTFTGQGIVHTIFGDYVLISGNTYQNKSNDAIRQFGAYFIVRNNTMTDGDDGADGNNDHMDFWQSWCNTGAGANHNHEAEYLWAENNTYSRNAGRDTHFALINGTDDCAGPPEYLIYRYNKIYYNGSRITNIDANSERTARKNSWYNNTVICSEECGTGSDIIGNWNASSYSSVKNNIIMDSMQLSSIRGFAPHGTGWEQDGNLYYDPNGTITFTAPSSNETNRVSNENPLIANYTSDVFSLSEGSPAIDAGVALTIVASADTGSGTSLVVTDAKYFQTGFGLPGVEADWIAVGAVSNVVQIDSIDYDTNTITLTGSINRSDGDSVRLYKDSDGTVVLAGTETDIGAVEYGVTEASTPATIQRATIQRGMFVGGN